MTLAIGFIWFCALKIARVWREPGDRPTWRWRLGALVIGVLMGLVALVAFQQIMPARTCGPPPASLRLWWATVCGLPGLLGVFGLAVVYVIGVSGRQFEEDSREWWSRLGGVLFGVAVGWLVVAGLAVYAPPWVMKLTRLAQGLSVAWLVTTIAGVRAAMSGSTGKPGSISWRDRLAMITPYVFLAGLLIALAFGIHAALAAWHGDHTFTPAGHDYFGDITEWLSVSGLGAPFLFSAALALFFSWRIDVNVFAFHMFYRNRLVRCYLGASNPRRANHPFTGFDGDDSVRDAEPSPAPLPSRQRGAEHHPRHPAGVAGAKGGVLRRQPDVLRVRAEGRRSRRAPGATSARSSSSPRRTRRGRGRRTRAWKRRGGAPATIRIPGRSSWGSGPRWPSPERRQAPIRDPIPLPRSRS